MYFTSSFVLGYKLVDNLKCATRGVLFGFAFIMLNFCRIFFVWPFWDNQSFSTFLSRWISVLRIFLETPRSFISNLLFIKFFKSLIYSFEQNSTYHERIKQAYLLYHWRCNYFSPYNDLFSFQNSHLYRIQWTLLVTACKSPRQYLHAKKHFWHLMLQLQVIQIDHGKNHFDGSLLLNRWENLIVINFFFSWVHSLTIL